MSAVKKVTDLVNASLDHLASADNAADPAVASRHERRAGIYSELAKAQSGKTANVIAYLNSDRAAWSLVDENVVRSMLGLPELPDQGGQGSAPAGYEPETPDSEDGLDTDLDGGFGAYQDPAATGEEPQPVLANVPDDGLSFDEWERATDA